MSRLSWRMASGDARVVHFQNRPPFEEFYAETAIHRPAMVYNSLNIAYFY
jgi:hypothetical protein